MILLDTHALVWPDAGDARLERRALDRIRTAWRELALDGHIGLEATRLPGGLHGDPADRLIAATGVAHEACLVTADRRLLDSRAPGLRCLDAAR